MKPIVAVLAVCLMMSCESSNNAGSNRGGPPNDLVLRSYDVPEGAAQLRAVINNLLWFGSDGKDQPRLVGRVDTAPSGQLVVLANESVQAGVKSLVEGLAKNPPKAISTIEINYWFVYATPGKGTAPGASLQELLPALAEIEKTDGPQQFTLDEKLTVSSTGGESAEVNGRNASAKQVASAGARGISADLHLQRGAEKLETRVNLQAGQIAVLGSSGARSADKDDKGTGSLYYVIRAATHDGRAP